MLEGAYRDRLVRASGATLDLPRRSNLVVWSALDLIGALLCNRSTGITYLAVGSGDPAWDANPPPPDRGRTRLENEVFRVRVEPGGTLTYDAASGRVRVRASIGRGKATGTLRELGLFGGNASGRPGSGVLVNHSVHPAIQKGENDTLRRELLLTLEQSLGPGARDLIGGLLARRTGLRGITHVALGTSGAAADRKLAAEAYRRRLDPIAVSYDSPTHTVEASARFELGEGPPEVREAGLFGGTAEDRPGTGLLVTRETTAPIDRREPKRLERRFQLVLVAKTDVAVPNLVETKLDDARASLIATELLLAHVTDRETEASPAGTVLEQDPASGTVVNEGAPVTLVVAVPPSVTVPEIVGEPEDQAKALLVRLGLTVLGDARVERESPRPRGTVLASSPPPGARIPKGTGVALTVAVPVQVRVPDVRGRTPAAATVLLRAAGLELAPEPHPTQETSVTPGTVLAQDPEAGAEAATGSEVELTLATPWTVEVPDVRKKTTEEAAKILAEAADALIEKLNLPPGIPGLALGAVEERPVDAPVGTIVEQTPAAKARAALYSTVDVIVAAVATEPVPKLLGLDETAAVAALASAGFTVGKVVQRPAEAPQGTVVDQEPAPDVLWARGGRVSITLAAARRATVPELVGLTLEAAKEALTGLGLVLGTTATRVEPGVPGTVVSQKPEALQVVKPGTRVNVVVRAGVLNVVGMTREEATAALEAVGVPVGRVDPREVDGPAGVVLEQNPAAGAPVDPTTRVTLVVSIAARLEVPDVTGRSLDDAKRALDAAGLSLDVTAKTESDEAEGTILAQDPAAGRRVERGTTVQVTIAVARRRTVAVPDVVGRTADDAKRILADAGLQIRVAEVRPAPRVPAGVVVDQSPAAGAQAERGGIVSVILASADTATEVPDVRRLRLPAARSRLESASLELRVASSTRSAEPEGTVLTQEPLPGSRVPAGSVVSVVVSAGGLILVPRVVNTQERVALNVLIAAGLTAEPVPRTTFTRPPGTVIGQEPEAGTPVEPGSTVVVFVATRELDDPFRPRREDDLVVIPGPRRGLSPTDRIEVIRTPLPERLDGITRSPRRFL